jgi:3-methyladenine DNA glycosylase AlkD
VSLKPLKLRAEIHSIESGLRPLGSPIRARGAKKYLKSELLFLGVSTPELRRLVRAWLRDHRDLSRLDLLRLTRALFRRRTHELRVTAIVLLQNRAALLEQEDLETLEWMLRRSKTWAYVDGLAPYVVGPLVERFPRLLPELDRWASDPDFWIRRSAILALLLPLRRGEGDWQRFTRYADSNLADREFFIRKAIGWVLREVSKKHPARVRDYLRNRIDRLSGVTFREAVKYLEEKDRETLTAAFRKKPSPLR